MKSLIQTFARHPVLPNLMMVIILLSGLWGFLGLRREANPEIKIDMVVISVQYPGASAIEVEEGIVVKIENAIKGVSGIKSVDGTALEGIGKVTVSLQDNAKNKLQIISNIKSCVDRISTFPKDSEKPRVEELEISDTAFLLVLYGDAPERILRELAFDIKDELTEKGLSKITLGGVRDYEIAIEASPEILSSFGLTLDQVASIVGKSSLNLPTGSIRTNKEEYKIEVKGRKYTGEDYKELVVKADSDGTLIRLKQVARVLDDFEEDESLGRYDGKRAVLITIQRTGDEDTIEIAAKVRDYIDEKASQLPPYVQMSVLGDFSEDIIKRISLLVTNGWQGLVLLFFVLWFFLSFQLSLWITLGIPIAFAFTGIVMSMGGYTLNSITLFGLILVLGIVVDDAIVIGENIHNYRQKGLSSIEASITGTAEIAWPVIAAVITTILAFLPLFFVSGVMGRFIAVMPAVVVATIVGSLLEGMLILPAHLGHGGGHKEEKEISFEDKDFKMPDKPGIGKKIRIFIDSTITFIIERVYQPIYYLSLEFRYAFVAITLACALMTAGLIAGGMVPFILSPDSDAVSLKAEVAFPDGTPLSVTAKAIDLIEKAAFKINEKYGGHGKDGFLTLGIYSEAGGGLGKTNEGKVTLSLVGPEERDLHSQDILNLWRKETAPISNVFNLKYSAEGGGIPVKDIEMFIMGDELLKLNKVAFAIHDALKKYDGVHDIENDFKTGKRELLISLKPQGRLLGITLQDLATQLRQGFYGTEVMKIQRGRDEVRVQVRYPKHQRASLRDLFEMKVQTPMNFDVPFKEVASVKMRRGIAEILRRDGKRRIKISCALDKAVVTPDEVQKDLLEKIMPELLMKYPGVRISFEGSKAEGQKSIQSLLAGFAFAAVGIYSVLAIIFRSYIQPLLIMATIPLGMIGAVVGHFFMGYPLSMLSLFGIVALSGVVVNDSLVLIDTINKGQRNRKTVWDSVKEAGPLRFRAIILTSVTTVAGLLPLLSEKSLQAQSLKPMALSLAAGLIFATVLTLFLIPNLYIILNDFRRVFHWLKTGYWPVPEDVEPSCKDLTKISSKL